LKQPGLLRVFLILLLNYLYSLCNKCGYLKAKCKRNTWNKILHSGILINEKNLIYLMEKNLEDRSPRKKKRSCAEASEGEFKWTCPRAGAEALAQAPEARK
jgi:hypothetical protein